MHPCFADLSDTTVPLHVLAEGRLATWLQDQSAQTALWVNANGFTGALGQSLTVPGPDGGPIMAVAGFGTKKSRSRGRFSPDDASIGAVAL